MQYYVGIDISKDSFHFCILNNSAQTIASGNLPMSLEGFKSLLNTLKSLPEPVVVMESSGRFHIPLYLFLTENNIQTFILNPKIVRRFFEFISANNPSKQDKKDAKILALFALSNPQFLKSYPKNSELRTLSRLIQKLKHDCSRKNLNQIRSFLISPEAEKHFNIYSHSFLNILLEYPSAKAIKKAKPSEISEIIKSSIQKGKSPSFTPEELISLAKCSIGVDDPYLSQTLVFYIEKLFFLEPRIKKLENMLIEKLDENQQEQIKFISSIKGISPKLASLFLVEIGDIKRFSNAKKLIKYAGTDPVIKQSGKYKVKMSISKQGSSFLRNVLFQMAVGVVKWNFYFRSYFLRKKKNFGSYKKAMIAVVNKLVRVIYAICTKGTFFNPSFSNFPSQEVSHV
ncbi:transposase IS116/IS110/IS902 family protein [Thermodesulfobacterium geofontis OPF15]|uniref:Transposase IS116/IS110/IS902 family protein n=1 Tax=Thermodesulfobacterium geofontis (strain OPF15) TaxID=795359 RepID=F8C284_THEGP|nr:IS110 family transposase [Thermodesulfobacterium geofontis]AEH23342.1 transposase IS116/IS110/IS902 family protein [Thermodesulfobacterium geofontis OPF15]